MLQTVFHIPGELFGLPMFGFGLLLAVWAAGTGIAMLRRIRRGGFDTDTQNHLLILILLGLAIVFVLPVLCDSHGLPIRGYGTMMLVAVVSGLGLAVYRAQRAAVDPEMVFSLAIWMIVPGIIGARAVYVAEYWSTQYLPVYLHGGLQALAFAVINVAAGGLVVYGSFIGGMLGLGLFWWRYRIPLLAAADLVAPSLLLGLALGRIGCFLNGCCYGGPCDLPWKVTFPWNSPVHQHEVAADQTDVGGLKFADGPGRYPVIESIAAGSPAATVPGLAPGLEVHRINGVEVSAEEFDGQRISASQRARTEALGIDRLALKLCGTDDRTIHWTVEDPPEAKLHRTGGLKIFGLLIQGDDDREPLVGQVRRPSPEAAAGIRPGMRLASVSGFRVDSIGQLRGLLDEHRRRPWLLLGLAGQAQPVKVAFDRPLPRSLAVHPTQLYSTIDALVLCALLLAYDRFRRRDGELTALMMTVYPVTRFLMESIRTDEATIWGTPFTISQNISLAILLVAAGLWIYVLRQPAKLAFGRR